MKTVVMICHCGKPYTEYMSNLQRGWGLSCSKSCAAQRRDHLLDPGHPKDTTINISVTKQKPNSCQPNDVRGKLIK